MGNKFHEHAMWFQQPLGQAVMHAVNEQIAAEQGSFSGQTALQLGLARQDWCRDLRIFNKYGVTAYPTKASSVIADYESLPFDSGSFNLIFLPLTLELYADVNLLLEELDRVLSGDGYLLICGINPVSLWGLAKLLHRSGVFPVATPYLRTSFSLRTLLVGMGYEICWIKSFFYRMPAVTPEALNKQLFLEQMGKMLWPYPGGIYLILAQKSESQLLAIKPLLHFRHYVIGKEFAQPTVRV